MIEQIISYLLFGIIVLGALIILWLNNNVWWEK